MNLLTKPCAKCGVPVRDKDDPTFKEPWLCYHCHCIATGKDPKTMLNRLAELVKLGELIPSKDRPSEEYIAPTEIEDVN